MTLIKRLEAAETGSRELDAAAYNACPEAGRIALRLPMNQWGDRFDDGWRTKWRDREDKYPEKLRHYTTSIDAALTLVPEGWQWQTSNRAPLPYAGRGYIHNGELHMSDKYQGFEAVAATPALALSAASLRAREAMKEKDDA